MVSHGSLGITFPICFCLGNAGLQEVSNPFLHLKFILRALRKGNQQLMLVNDAAFALSFFVCRLLVGPFVVWATVASPTTPWIVKVRATHCGCVLGGSRWVEVMAEASLLQLHGVALAKAPTSAACSVQVPVGT